MYKIQRTCCRCNHTDVLVLTKREAAFEIFDLDSTFGAKCSNCHDTKFSTSYVKPDLDLDLLIEWANSPSLCFMDQDEELIIAEYRIVGDILWILDNLTISNHKESTLLYALCVIIYDSFEENVEQAKSVAAELFRRKDKLISLEAYIHDYVKDVAWPVIFSLEGE